MNLQLHVDLIRQAFSYVNQFRRKIFVIKIDSDIVMHPHFSSLVRDLTLLHRIGIQIVLVPGAREHINEILTQNNMPWLFMNGRRITETRSIPFIKMAAFDVCNKLMTLLAENQTNAVIGNWVRARALGIRHGVDFQSAGVVDKVNTQIIWDVLEQGMVPIFPCIGWNKEGKPYNISSDDLASHLSQHLMAEKLFFVGHSLTVSPTDYHIPETVECLNRERVPKFNIEEAEQFITLNRDHQNANLIKLLSLGHQSCKHGVNRIHLVNGSIDGVILKEIFSNEGGGTMIYANEHINIRPMRHSDIPQVMRIMQPLIQKELLIPRSSRLLEENADDFVVYEVDNHIHGCGALHIWPQKKSELEGLAVDDIYANLGIGKKIVTYLLERAKHLNLEQVFVLTTQTSDWFSQLGFTRGEVSILPAQKRKIYDQKRNSAIYFVNI